jgi:hypothetical protein
MMWHGRLRRLRRPFRGQRAENRFSRRPSRLGCSTTLDQGGAACELTCTETERPHAHALDRDPMTFHRFDLLILGDRLAICRLDRHSALPSWATEGRFFSITRTGDELSIVCPEALVPEGVRVEKGWRALRVVGSMDFSIVGVLASLVTPLAGAGVPLFAISTFDTDYVLIKEHNLERAVEALTMHGHAIEGFDPRR